MSFTCLRILLGVDSLVHISLMACIPLNLRKPFRLLDTLHLVFIIINVYT